jgi:hypothetical protein
MTFPRIGRTSLVTRRGCGCERLGADIPIQALDHPEVVGAGGSSKGRWCPRAIPLARNLVSGLRMTVKQNESPFPRGVRGPVIVAFRDLPELRDVRFKSAFPIEHGVYLP